MVLPAYGQKRRLVPDCFTRERSLVRNQPRPSPSPDRTGMHPRRKPAFFCGPAPHLALRARALLRPRSERHGDVRGRRGKPACGRCLGRTRGLAEFRRGTRARGRRLLRQALDLADRQGANAVAERAAASLSSPADDRGGRRIFGPEALTPADCASIASVSTSSTGHWYRPLRPLAQRKTRRDRSGTPRKAAPTGPRRPRFCPSYRP